ncbi:MAG: hypothetical protein ACI9P7_000022 [Candidatus Azotimanducaceae bacterium]|jgi:hypothetical protein
MNKNFPWVAFHLIFSTAAVLSFLCAAYFWKQQTDEEGIVSAYLSKHELKGSAVTRETAIALSQQIRQDFNVDESSFKALDVDDRPFLRHGTGFLLTHLEGTCGQGTRVLVNLLTQLGFNDVTRLTMYDRYLNPSHTLVSVRMEGGEEFMVDTINTQEWFNTFINENDVTVADFPFIPYTNADSRRSELTRKHRGIVHTSEERQRFHNRFWLYSFDSTPISKLSAKLGLNVVSFQLDRPSPFISKLAERPNQIKMFVWIGISIAMLMTWGSLVWLHRLMARLVS